MKPTSLAISSRGRAIRNVFVDAGVARLAVVVAGFEYTRDMPLPYYLRRLLEEKGLYVLAATIGDGR